MLAETILKAEGTWRRPRRERMQIRQLEQFLVVADSATLTEAGHRLGMSQQGLSASIYRLEKELELELLVRPSRAVKLTAAGHRLAEAAVEVVAATDRMLKAARDAEAAGRSPN